MARTTSQSKAKTKTANKPSAARSTKTAKTTKKVVSKVAPKKEIKSPAVAEKVVKVSRSSVVGRLRRSITLTGIRKLHALSALIFVTLAIVAGAMIKASAYQLSIGHLTKDELMSKTTTVFAPAQHVLLSVDLRWVVVGVLAISALFSLLRMTHLEATEDKGLKAQIQPWRWVDLAVTGAVMVEVAALLYGVQELTTLKLVGALTVFSLVFAWIAERENSGATKFVKGSFIASVVSGIVVLSVFAGYGWATMTYGAVRFPWYAYALFGSAVVTAALLALNQYKGFKRVKAGASYLLVERNYLLINLTAKIAFAVILIVGLRG